MTRTVTVTGGFSGSAVIDLTDSLGQLVDSTFAVALTDVGAVVPPPVGDAAWSVVGATPTDKAATFALTVENTVAPGTYHAAIDVRKDGRHEIVWATDRRGRRALLVVT